MLSVIMLNAIKLNVEASMLPPPCVMMKKKSLMTITQDDMSRILLAYVFGNYQNMMSTFTQKYFPGLKANFSFSLGLISLCMSQISLFSLGPMSDLWPQFTNFPNKLECLSMEPLQHSINFVGKLEPSRVEHLNGANLYGIILVLPTNI